MWQARRESNPQPAVLETAALPIELLAYHLPRRAPASSPPLTTAVRPDNKMRQPRLDCNTPLARDATAVALIPSANPNSAAAQGSDAREGRHCRIFVTTPAPTVRPPSRIAKRKPSSIAIGLISSTVIFTLSPGITISTPAGKSTAPVTSVVRK